MPLKACLVPYRPVGLPEEIFEDWPDPLNPLAQIRVAVAKVPLLYGGWAYLRATKFNDVMASRYSDQFFKRSNGKGNWYVSTTHPDYPHATFTVSRLITDPGKHTRVRLVDRDPCNLRCHNLQVGGGYSLGLERIDPNQDPVTGW